MAVRSPRQLAVRRRFEGAIALAAPFLDLIVAAGDRILPRAARSSPLRSRLGGRD